MGLRVIGSWGKGRRIGRRIVAGLTLTGLSGLIGLSGAVPGGQRVGAVTVPLTPGVPSISAYVGGYGADGVAITSWPSVDAPTALPKSRKLLDVSSPTFVRSHPKLPVIYVTSEMGADRRNLRSVTAAGVVLSVVNSGGTAPVRSDVNAVGDRLAVANYDGSVALFALTRNGAIGNRLALVSLGNGSGTQGAAVTTGSSGEPDGARLSHPHSVTFNPSGTELWVADIGTDLVMRFDLGPKRSTLTEAERLPMTPGSGPRQVVFGSGGVTYVAAELDGHIDVLARATATATATTTRLVRRVAIRPAARTAELTLHPSGRWLIALSRGTGQCIVYLVRGDTLTETSAAACGNWPRFSAFDRSGSLLLVAAQRGDQVLEFSFDANVGALTKVNSVHFSKPAVVVPFTGK